VPGTDVDRTRLDPGYSRKMLSPETLICTAGRGEGAGPATTAPVLMLYWLPWHGQSIVPLETWLTVQPMWVQTALKALNSPDAGWVTTTFLASKIVPLPTGILLVAVSAPAEDAGADADAPLLAAAVPAPVGADVVEALAGVELLEALELQAVMAPARPTKPTLASTPRRVACESLCGSCVTTAPIHICVRWCGRGSSGHPPLYRGTERSMNRFLGCRSFAVSTAQTAMKLLSTAQMPSGRALILKSRRVTDFVGILRFKKRKFGYSERSHAANHGADLDQFVVMYR